MSTFDWVILGMPRLSCGRYSQRCSLGGRGDAAPGYHYCSNLKRFLFVFRAVSVGCLSAFWRTLNIFIVSYRTVAWPTTVGEGYIAGKINVLDRRIRRHIAQCTLCIRRSDQSRRCITPAGPAGTGRLSQKPQLQASPHFPCMLAAADRGSVLL